MTSSFEQAQRHLKERAEGRGMSVVAFLWEVQEAPGSFGLRTRDAARVVMFELRDRPQGNRLVERPRLRSVLDA